jgi:hypothetical protein
VLRTLKVMSRPSRRTERPCSRWAPGTLTLIVTVSRAWLEPGVGVTAEMRGAVMNSNATKTATAHSATIATIRKR